MQSLEPLTTTPSAPSLTDGIHSHQFLTFILAGEEYGLDILRVLEIKGWSNTTAIPNTPDYVKGVINLRGTIVPVVDLRQKFNMAPTEYGPTTVVIVLRVESIDRTRTMGIVVDAVSDVYDIDDQEVKAAPDFGDGIDTAFVNALATVNDKMVILLDVDALLSSDAETNVNEGGE